MENKTSSKKKKKCSLAILYVIFAKFVYPKEQHLPPLRSEQWMLNKIDLYFRSLLAVAPPLLKLKNKLVNEGGEGDLVVQSALTP